VFRAITSVAATIMLMAVLIGGACAGCWAPLQKATHCCHPTGQCDKAGNAPVHSECASQPVDLAVVEQASHVAVALEPAAGCAPAIMMRPASNFEAPREEIQPYLALDLCVLHSVLTI